MATHPSFASDLPAPDYGPPGQVVHLVARKPVCFEGDPADTYFRIEEGSVCAQRFFLDGSHQITALFSSGAYLGLANAGVHGYSAEALCDTTLIKYRREDLKAWLADRPERIDWLLGAIDAETTALNIRSLTLACRTPLERFATFLLLVMGQQGAPEEIQLYLTREEIGDYLGLCMETVSRCVSRLRARSVIEAPAPHRLIIRDYDALNALASDDILEAA